MGFKLTIQRCFQYHYCKKENIENTAPAAGWTVASNLRITKTTTNIVIAVNALKTNFFNPQNTALRPNIPLIESNTALF